MRCSSARDNKRMYALHSTALLECAVVDTYVRVADVEDGSDGDGWHRAND